MRHSLGVMWRGAIGRVFFGGVVVVGLVVPLALVLGVIAALYENKPVDGAIGVGSLAVVGLPEFVTGLVLIQIFSIGLRTRGLPYLPANSSIEPGASFLEALPMLILPAITATLVLLAYIARLTRVGVVEELKRSYVRTADLKGLPRRTGVSKHVLRNALLPAITVIDDDITEMELEAYEDVATQELEKIAKDATEQFRLLHVDIIHRIGRLDLGENILIIIVAAGHREEAYEAPRYIIEAIKAGVPIWKKELTKDGGRWVPGDHRHGKSKTP